MRTTRFQRQPLVTLERLGTSRNPLPLLRAAVDALESRVLLSTVVVNSVLDTLFPTGSPSISLRSAVAIANAATEPTTIKFDATVFASKKTITLGGTQLELSNTKQPTTLIGPSAGVIVSGDYLSRVFYVARGVTSSLSKLTITKGSNSGIYNKGIATLNNVILSENKATYAGGGICNTGNITLNNVTLSRNTTTDGGGNGNGGGIWNYGTATLNNVILSENKSTNGGGIYNTGNITLNNVTVSGNSALLIDPSEGGMGYGGGISNGGTATLIDVTVSGNTSDGIGGGIDNAGNAKLINTVVSGNTSLWGGGGIWNVRNATLTNVTVSGNKSTNVGGGICSNGGNVTLTTVTVSGNTLATGDGGGIYIAGTGTLTNVTVSGNKSSTGGGISIADYASATLTDATVSGNTSTNTGGGIDNRGTATLKNVNVSGNTATGNSGGGIANSGSATLNNVTVSGNSVSDGYPHFNGSAGGGIDNTGTLTMTNGTVSDNTATGNSGGGKGGGVYNTGTATLTRVTISGNTATSANSNFVGYGGGIHNSGTATMTLTHVTVSGNTAKSDNSEFVGTGGGIYNTGTATMTLNDAAISGNIAPRGGGGGIHNLSGTITLTKATVSGNTASGGAAIANSGTITLSNVLVSGNTSTGDDGSIVNDGSVTLTNVTVSGNTSEGVGGGISNYYGSITLTNVTVSGNTSRGGGGGGIHNVDGTITLTNVTVSGNTADYYAGGGIYNDGKATLTNVTVSGNTVSGNGGGIANYFKGTLTLANTLIAGNINTSGGIGPDVSGAVKSLGYNLIGKTDGSTGWIASDLKGTAASPINPKLANLTNNGGPTQTMMLLPGSPALDRGSNAFVFAAGIKTDQRGFNRIANGIVDIGAVERLANVTKPAAPSELVATVVSATKVKLTWKDNSFNEDRFLIEASFSAGGPWTQVSSVGANNKTCTVTGLTTGKTHFFRVRANNSAGSSAYSNLATALPSAAGHIDTTFGVNGFAAGDSGEILIRKDASFYAGLTHYNAGGQTIATIHPDVASGPAFPFSTTAIDTDSKVLAGGYVNVMIPVAGESVKRYAIERFNPDGSLDPSFVTLIMPATNNTGDQTVRQILAQSDGKILVAGAWSAATPVAVIQGGDILRYLSDGNLDTTFSGKDSSPGSFGTYYYGSSDIVRTGAGQIYFTSPGVTTTFLGHGVYTPASVTKLSQDGDLIQHTNLPFALALPEESIEENSLRAAIQPDGKVVVAGVLVIHHDTAPDTVQSFVCRYSSDLVLDKTFGNNGVVRMNFGLDAEAADVTVQKDNKILLAGTSAGKVLVVRLDGSGKLDRTFDDDGYAQFKLNDQPDTHADGIALTSDGKILVSASGSGVSGVVRLFG